MSQRKPVLRTVIIGIIVVIVALCFLPGTFLYRPLVNHLKGHMEDRWNCRVQEAKTVVDLLSGTVRSENVNITGAQGGDVHWELRIQDLVVDVDYSSLVQGTLVLNELLLNAIFFEMDKKTGTKDSATAGHPSPEKETPGHQEVRPAEEQPRPAILIRHLRVKGSFEATYRIDNRIADKIQVKQVAISRDDISFSGTPDELIGSLVKEAKELTGFTIRP